MTRNSLKYVASALLFVDLCSVAILGLLLGFVIPSGNASGAGKIFLGLRRHAWADIHLTLAIAFLALIALHVWLNWDWVVGTTKKFFGEQWQNVIWILSGSWVAVIIAAWIIVKLH